MGYQVGVNVGAGTVGACEGKGVVGSRVGGAVVGANVGPAEGAPDGENVIDPPQMVGMHVYKA